MSKTYIIAEIAQGYEGDINLCKRFVKLAKKSGANAVKFQIFEAEELSIPGYKYHELFKSLYINPDKWKEVIKLANDEGIDFYADIFGTNTLAWITKCKIKGIKIHSSDVKNFELLNAVKNKNYNIVLGVGGSTLEEIEKAIKALGKNKITLMSGFQAEPNLIEDIELHKLKILKEKFKLKVGYADHIDVKTELSLTLPAMAVLMGADYIEKHLTMERDYLELEDYLSALNPSEFLRMVVLIRNTERFPNIFSNKFELTEREIKYRLSSKKVILAKENIKKGTLIADKHLQFLRTGEEYSELLDISEIVGKKAKKDIVKNAIIKKTHL